MRYLLLSALFIGLLLAAPLFGHEVTITGTRGGVVVYRLVTSLEVGHEIPQTPGVKFVVTVGDAPDDDDPPPDDDDDPPPPDDLPEGKYKVSRPVRDLAKQVDHPQRAQLTDILAKSFAALPGLLSRNNIESVETAVVIEKTTRTLLFAQFPGSKEAWAGVTSAIEARVKALIDGGQITTVAQFSACMIEISLGLNAVLSPADRDWLREQENRAAQAAAAREMEAK